MARTGTLEAVHQHLADTLSALNAALLEVETAEEAAQLVETARYLTRALQPLHRASSARPDERYDAKQTAAPRE